MVKRKKDEGRTRGNMGGKMKRMWREREGRKDKIKSGKRKQLCANEHKT